MKPLGKAARINVLDFMRREFSTAMVIELKPAQVQAGVKTALGAFASAGGARRGKQDKAA